MKNACFIILILCLFSSCRNQDCSDTQTGIISITNTTSAAVTLTIDGQNVGQLGPGETYRDDQIRSGNHTYQLDGNPPKSVNVRVCGLQSVEIR